MNPTLRDFLDRLATHGREHDSPLEDRLLRLRNMKPEAAALIATLIRVQRSTSVLEIGTSNGYSAIWFGDAVRDTGGHLTTVEKDAERVSEARRNLTEADVAAHVTVVQGDGAEVLRSARDGSIDLVVLDAERPAYVAYWSDILRVLTPAGVLAVDNAISHGGQLVAFRQLVAADAHFYSDTFSLGDGVFVATRFEGVSR